MGRLGRESHMAMCCKVLFLLVLVAEQGMGSPFIRIPPAIADMLTPAINLLQAGTTVVTPGGSAGSAGSGAVGGVGGAVGGTTGGAVVVPGTAAMTVPAMTMMMNNIFPALGLGIIKGILISQLLKPPKKEKKKYYAPPPPTYGYHENSYADPYGGYDHHARSVGY